MNSAPLEAPQARMLPHDISAERTILGAVLVDGTALNSAAALLGRDDFYREAHQRIFHAMLALSERRESVDLVTLKAELSRRRALEGVGGAAYLAGLVEGVPRVVNLEPWCRILRRASALRRLAAIGSRLVNRAYEAEEEPEELVARVDAALLKLGAGLSSSSEPRPLSAGIKAASDRIEQRMTNPRGLVGYSTGLRDLDTLLQGIRPGSMGLIGARLGSGKSILGLQIATAIAKQSDEAVLVSSLEMDLTELTERALSSDALVDTTRLHLAAPHDREARWTRLAHAAARLPQSLLVVEDAYTVADLRLHARQLQSSRGLAAVMVDYVGLMDAPADRFAREWEKVAAISKAMRRLAAELHVPVIVVAQLNREPEGGGKRRAPTMADLAGTDALGRDAHWAVLIDLEPPAPKGHDPHSTQGLADLYVRKNRFGRKGVVRVVANLGFARFDCEGEA